MQPYAIYMRSDKPIAIAPYKFSGVERAELDKQMDQLKQAGVIENSQSVFAAPVFLVNKPDHQYWMVVDYRKFNENMEPDRFP